MMWEIAAKRARKDKNMRDLRTIFLIDESNAVNTNLDISYDLLNDGNDAYVFEHILSLLKEELSQIENERLPMSLLRFCSISNKDGFEEIKKDIHEGRLTLSNPFNFNDPMDPILKVWIKLHKKQAEDKNNKKFFKMVSNALKNMRICCMADYSKLSNNAPLMWSHYANSHKGIAIKYKINEDVINKYNDDKQLLRICPIVYREGKPLTDSITLDNAFFAKGQCWKYEAEHRLVYFTTESSDIKEFDDKTGKLKRKNYLPLSGFEIEKVYLGAEIDLEKQNEICKITKEKRIPTYKMYYDSYDITRLECEKID